MKRLITLIIIVVIAVATLVTSARVPRKDRPDIPFMQLVDSITVLSHWNQENLAQLGLQEIFSDSEEDEECGTFSYFVYGSKVEIATQDGWDVTLAATGPHAYAIEVTLMTDNETNLYFKDESDYQIFISCIKQSSKYNSDYDQLGYNLIERKGLVDGWYVISFHAG